MFLRGLWDVYLNGEISHAGWEYLKTIEAEINKLIEIARNSRKREQETVRKKEDVWTKETSKWVWKYFKI